MSPLSLDTAYYIEGAVCLALPVLAVIVWHGRTKSRVSPFFVGALIFFAFALVLEQLLHYFALNPSGPFAAAINGSVLLKAAYGGLAAGIFEETGRFVGFKFLLARQTSRETAVTYGLGHGGCECFLLAGVIGIANGLAAGGILSAAVLGTTQSALMASLSSIAPATVLWAVPERISAMLLHIALSIFVFKAVNVPGRGWLYPLAVLIHALVDGIMVYAAGFISSIAVLELLIFVCCALVFAVSVKTYKGLPRTARRDGPETV